MSLRFDDPVLLWVAAAAPLFLVASLLMRSLPLSRRIAAGVLRSAAVAAAALAIARPSLVLPQESLTVIGVVDASGSVRRLAPSTPPEASIRAFAEAARSRPAGDRAGVVVFDGQASAAILPTAGPLPALTAAPVSGTEGSDLAGAITLARALVPAGEAGRVVLISDGLENRGSALHAVERDGARSVPVDSVEVPLERVPDVRVAALDLPAAALPLSTVEATILLDSTDPATVRLKLRMDGRPVALQGGAPQEDGAELRLPGGPTTVRLSLPLGGGPVHRVEAIVESADPALDRIPENSRAARLVAVPSGRSALLVGAAGPDSPTAALLRASGLEVRTLPADALPEDPLWLAGFDLVVLENVPAAAMDPARQELLADQVERVGGGLLCLGGPETFGPGGWRGSALGSLLPVEVEPPTEARRPEAAVAFVIDRSGSMRAGVAGARASQQEVANAAAALAVESVATRILVTVVAFSNSPEVLVPLRPLDDRAAVAEEIRGISSDGGTAIGAALKAALDQLEGAGGVQRRLVVLLTDGRGSDDQLLRAQSARARDADVKVTTISVGDEADDGLLAEVAATTGGVFHAVRNPRVLPRILVDAVQEVNRPLLRLEPVPVVPAEEGPVGPLLKGAPALAGSVIVGPPRSADAVVDARSELGDPLVARWQAGTGRVALVTAAPDGPWCEPWRQWPGAAGFWQALLRWTARSPASAPVAADARVADGVMEVVVEAAAADAVAGSEIAGVARSPEGARVPLTLRRVSPRRFEGRIPAEASGTWMAVLTPTGPRGPLPPMLASATAPEGAEYRRTRSDPDLLRKIRSASGGAERTLGTLSAAGLFSRDGLRMGTSESPIAAWLLAACAILLVGDVAVRRLAVRRQQLRDATRVVSADPTGARTLASRRATPAAPATAPATAAAPAARAPAERPAPAVQGAGSAGGSDAGATRAAGRAPPAAAPASEEEIRAALAAIRGGSARTGPPGAGADPPKGAPGSPEAPPAGGAEAHPGTLDALRRARDRSRIFPP